MVASSVTLPFGTACRLDTMISFFVPVEHSPCSRCFLLTGRGVPRFDSDLFVFDMSDPLAPLRLFVRVARTGSFSRAGRELAVSQPSASRIIAALEREVGAPLLTRTTRVVVLTEAGSEYLTRVEPLLDALEEANQAARGTGELRGVLRLGLPISIAVREIIPRLPRFLSRHPALRMSCSWTISARTWFAREWMWRCAS